MGPFDVFLSYNRSDLDAVRGIYKALTAHGLKAFLDKEELPPGQDFTKLIEEANEKSKAIAVFIGPEGLGEFQELEVPAGPEGRPVIPVLLPGAPAEPKLPMTLRRLTWVKFHEDVNDSVALYNLRWGITLEKPKDDPKPPAANVAQANEKPEKEEEDLDDPVAATADTLSRMLMHGNISYFLGAGVSQPPSSYELSRELLQKLTILNPDDKFVPPVDLSAYYYAIKEGDRSLENKVVDLLVEESDGVRKTHLELAALLKLLEKRPKRRLRDKRKQLIVTTNFDLMMERALLREGVSFSRLVQHRSLSQIDISQYHVERQDQEIVLKVDPDDEKTWRRARRDDFDELDELITDEDIRLSVIVSPVPRDEKVEGSRTVYKLPRLAELTGAILYKFHGSEDIQLSCAISTDHYFDFLLNSLGSEGIPDTITEIVANTPILFLGYSLLDAEFRLIHHTLLRRSVALPGAHSGTAAAMNDRFAVQRPPQGDEEGEERRVESLLWNKLGSVALQMGVSTVETDEASFLESLSGFVNKRL